MKWDSRSLRYRNERVDAPGGGEPAGGSRIILLVHGYNNDKAEADDSYAILLSNLAKFYDGPREEEIWKFYWPGYVERITNQIVEDPVSVAAPEGTESNALLSAPTYALQVLKARDVGVALGRYLRELPGAETIQMVFVAHSLGCRVVLEALCELLKGSNADAERHRIPCVCLMAAAVPTFMVEEESRLAAAAMVPQTAYILHSRSDWVLRFAFPPGQGAATVLRRLSDPEDSGEEGLLPEAVGRHGNPPTTWLRRGDTGLGHSGYWKHPSTVVNVLRALRGTVARELRVSTFEPIEWTLPPAPELPDWKNRAANLVERRRDLG